MNWEVYLPSPNLYDNIDPFIGFIRGLFLKYFVCSFKGHIWVKYPSAIEISKGVRTVGYISDLKYCKRCGEKKY